VWDLHYPPPQVLARDYPISAIYGATPLFPLGPAVLPGAYTIRLQVDGRSYAQPLSVRMDPRVRISSAGLLLQRDIGVRMNDAIARDFAALSDLRAQRTLLKTQREGAKRKEIADSLVAIDSALAIMETGGAGGTAASLVRLNEELAGVLDTVEGADAEPTSQAVAAAGELERSLDTLLERWSTFRRTRLKLQKP
jgi:hypothetical protein